MIASCFKLVIPFVEDLGFARKENRAPCLVEEENYKDNEDAVDNDLDVKDPRNPVSI